MIRALLSVLVMSGLLSACSAGGDSDEAGPSASSPAGETPATTQSEAADNAVLGPLATKDMAPVLAGEPVPVPGDGVTVEGDGATVEVAPGTVPGGDAEIVFAEPFPPAPVEVFGPAVGIEHRATLGGPVEVRWDIRGLNDDQRASLVLVSWDDELGVWVPDSTGEATFHLDGDTLVASISRFSWWDWVANVGQEAGELTGSRRDGPTCSGALPGWVRGTVDPDESTAAAALRVCFAPDPNEEETVTVRVVNNRPFTQRLDMTDGGQAWAWTWPGPDDLGVSGALYEAARVVFDSPSTHLLPPLTESAVGIARPDGGGSHLISATARVDWVTVLIDLVVYLFDKVSPGGFDNPMLDAFVGLVFECGGSAALDQPGDAAALVRSALGSIATCSDEILRPGSPLGDRYEAALLQQIGTSANPDQLVRANRWLHELAGAVKVLDAGKVAFYVTDQLQNAAVGPLTLSIRGDGRAGELGTWTATCSDLATDSNRLYRDIALREPFTDLSRALQRVRRAG